MEKEYRKIDHCKTMIYMLSQVSSKNIYIYLPKHTPQPIYDQLKQLGINWEMKTGTYNTMLKFNLGHKKVEMMLDTRMYVFIPFKHEQQFDVSLSSMLFFLYRVLYYLPQLDITDINKIPYTNLTKHLTTYNTNKHILNKRLEFYTNTLNELKQNKKILHDFMNDLYKEQQDINIEKYY